jgi:hypothetical protein
MSRRVVNLEELDVDIEKVDTADHLIGLFTSCRNIKKFTLRTWRMDDVDLTRIFRAILPLFSDLEELTIDNDVDEDLTEVFDVISSSCPNLRKLGVPDYNIEDAENYFQNRNVIIFEY